MMISFSSITFLPANAGTFDAVYIEDGSKEGQALKEEAQKLISDGLESRLLSVLQDLLSSSYPEHMVS